MPEWNLAYGLENSGGDLSPLFPSLTKALYSQSKKKLNTYMDILKTYINSWVRVPNIIPKIVANTKKSKTFVSNMI